MTWLPRCFRRDRLDRDLDDELEFHVEAHTHDLVAEGVPADEARRRALATFGGLEPIKEAAREVRRGRWLDDLWQDLRYALRSLRREPGFAVVAVLTLTLGIGANTAIFSMVNAVLLRPLAVRDPQRLVMFSDDVTQGERFLRQFPAGQWSLFSTEAYDFLRAQSLPFTSVAAFSSGDFRDSLEIPGREIGRQSVDVDLVSANYFETLGAAPALGRTLTSDDGRLGSEPAAVAGDRFWREHLGADPGAIGRTIKIGDDTFTIVGVMPPSFFSVRVLRAPDVWVPSSSRDGVRNSPQYYHLNLIGRLDAGQTMAAAEAAVTRSLQRFLASKAPGPLDEPARQRIAGVHVTMADGSRGISITRAEHSRLLLLLLSAVGVILLIAGANVGTLFLARAAAREREVAVRRALGAGRGRLIRQWLTESALLGGAGAVCGAAIAWFAAPRLLAVFVPPDIPVAATIDGAVLAFTTGVTLVACLLFGLAPSLRAGRVDPVGALRVAGRGHRRRRAFGVAEPLVVAQVAMSLVLVLGATLLTRTLLNLQRQPFGFDQANVLLVGVNPRFGGYRTDTAAALYRRIHDRLVELPGVERVSFARYSPFSGSRFLPVNAVLEGYTPPPSDDLSLEAVLVGPGYPQTLGMRLVRGRAFSFEDTAATPLVAMVNETFGGRFFPAVGPIGRRVDLGGATRRQSYEIVGVVRDAHFRNARAAVPPMVFIPMLQEQTSRILDGEIAIRTQGEAGAMAGSVRRAIAEVDARIRIDEPQTLRAQVRATFGPERTAAGFIVAFAVLALLVASVGLYGIVAHGLNRRTNEIGVRVALGAARLDIVRLVARETLLRLGIGLLIGVVLARAAGRLLASQLFGVTPGDAVSTAIAALVLSAVVALTTVRPLRRAMRIDPVTALRAE